MVDWSGHCVADPALLPEKRGAFSPAALLLMSKPGIVLAEVMSCLAGMLLATPGVAAPVTVPVLLSVAMAASGAAMLNVIIERFSDRAMPRLERRCRALEGVGAGRTLLSAVLLMAGGLLLAAATAPPAASMLLAVGCLSYLWLYTAWLKRRTPWSVLAGGIPGALPALIGAAAVGAPLAKAPLLLALFIYIWQLPHFWLLALECSDQYAAAGIPVLPLTHGAGRTRALTLAAALLLLPVTLAIGLLGNLSTVYLALAAGAGALFPLLCVRCLYRSHAYRQGFRLSLAHLVVIIGAICAESLAACLRW